MKSESFTINIAEKTLTAEFSNLAGQANGSVLLKQGDTTILVTAVMSEWENSTLNYFPLSVEFEERFYSAGAILGSRFQRREGRPSDEAILSARIVDRTIRPLFNQNIRRDVQVVVTVLALGEDDPDVLGVIGASLALAVSDIPWRGPVGCVRLGRNKKSRETIINPTYENREEGKLDLEIFACGKKGTINMVETASQEVSESDISSLLEESLSIHKQLEEWQKVIVEKLGKEKQPSPIQKTPQKIRTLFESDFRTKLSETIFSNTAGKSHIYELKKSFLIAVKEAEMDETVAGDLFEEAIDTELHRGALEEGRRADGRGMDEVRELFAKAGEVSPALHGSGIFYRGGTHIFSALTLGGPDSAQLIDTIETQNHKKNFIHHYNFPPYSVGETGRVGGFNRRMIGHGALAEKALLPVIPSQSDFPYTIRLVSETLSSNGSSSMGSVCASTLAMMDGGVPITRPVAGIASGVMMGENKYVLLTDIQGPEDEFGDMDFKVAGTTEGVTAIQMDVKVDGVPLNILTEALEKARLARLQILKVMTKEISSHRKSLSTNAPQIITLSILPDQIGLVIGGGGKTVNGIKDATGVDDINIEDDGSVFI
ncbi:MAG: polyribonucleotide nucleotidyltransferase, partial [Candidatus Pacebacteria bacterium]|nr:polyribonucleotide nucleotidyltransferase [Candidatus Paceibacterota bacterium]